MKQADVNKAIKKLHAEQQVKVIQDGANRARSVTVGTAFGGTIEVCMRVDGGSIWAILQPVEALELAHQIAAAAGCHIAMRPREDFGSWREWKQESSLSPQFPSWPEHPPQVKNKPAEQMLPAPEEQPGLKLDRSNKNGVAIKKTVDRRSAKRTSKSS
jgi:hypothetical protein